MKTAVVDGIEYYTRANPRGYGHQIMKKLPREGRPDRFIYQEVFCARDKNLVLEIFKQFEEGILVTEFPNTLDETYPEKMLVYRSKHYTGYYSVPTYKALLKTMRHILKQEYCYDGDTTYIDSLRPEEHEHNDSGVNSQEEINSIPIEKVREEVQEKWNAYQKRINDNIEYARDYENLRLVVTTETKGNSWAAMDAFERDNYELETLQTVDK